MGTRASHATVAVVAPQGQRRGPASGHGPHSPAWHTTAHVCRPQPSALPHTPSQRREAATAHVAPSRTRPQRQGAASMNTSHGGHGPAWHTAPQRCPQPSTTAHLSPHENAPWPQRTTVRTAPQWQAEGTVRGHGAQAPRWHCVLQLWPQGSRFPHGASQQWGSRHGSRVGASSAPQ